jgi:hypothetical protein
MRVITLILTTSLLTGLSGFSFAAELSCSARSGNTTVPLLELYTSEGCSSCPPADEWLSSFRQSGLVPDRVVPLALHVDYWNDLGWEDSYSQKTFTDRQYRLAGLNRMRSVFTPQFVLNGRNLSRWHSANSGSGHQRYGAAARISLVLSARRAKSNRLTPKRIITRHKPICTGDLKTTPATTSRRKPGSPAPRLRGGNSSADAAERYRQDPFRDISLTSPGKHRWVSAFVQNAQWRGVAGPVAPLCRRPFTALERKTSVPRHGGLC